MANLNKVLLIGNLTRDPELRYVPSGTAVATFGIAVNRVYSDKAGQKQQDTCFVNVVVWGRRAEVCGEYLSKGRPVFIEGRLNFRSWDGQDGQKRSALEVVANDVQFLGSPKDGKRSTAQPNADIPTPEMDVGGIDAIETGPQEGSRTEPKDDEVPF